MRSNLCPLVRYLSIHLSGRFNVKMVAATILFGSVGQLALAEGTSGLGSVGSPSAVLQMVAQETSIKNIDTNSGDTTISIEKGKKRPEAIYQVIDSSGEIAGEPDTLRKTARDSWKKACDEWKKETRDLNKQNQLISINCNSPSCSADSDGTVCRSTGTYKVKVLISQDK